ncbi:MAG TPA: hypothetical protein VKU94_02850 [Geobacterales bacterium]|nr:hypothetical protein [Geobacterales bacterium]
MIIIRTRFYNEQEIKEIIKIRAREEKVDLSEDALEELTKVGLEHSLRYATQLLSPSLIRAKEMGRNKVEKEDVEYIKKLFVSTKESVEYVKELEKYFLR